MRALTYQELGVLVHEYKNSIQVLVPRIGPVKIDRGDVMQVCGMRSTTRYCSSGFVFSFTNKGDLLLEHMKRFQFNTSGVSYD